MRVCSEHLEPVVWEDGGVDMPTIFGRWYCPTCQATFIAALDRVNEESA